MQKRSVMRVAGLAMVAAIATGSAPVNNATSFAAVEVTVFKSPTCGCCKEWVDHLRKHAFAVTAKDTTDMNTVKRTLGVPEGLYSCHTAVVNGYVIEGHVPAADIRRMLKEKPKIAGIAVPGMPAGSPGMEMGSRKDAYNVVAFKRDGGTSIYAKH
jgi:hypothetical protein